MRLLATIVAGFALLALPASAAAVPGALDGSFGSGGVTSLASGTELFGVALQSDGEIVASGDAGGSLLVERFSASGAPEAAFGGGAGIARGVAIQPDGKIVVAGYDSAGMLVERFNANGTLDSSFGSGGVVHAVPGGRANGVALGPGGTIIAAGQATGPDGFQHAEILRLTATGSPDTSFAGSGSELVLGSNKDAIANAVAVQADGGIVLAGSIGPGTSQAIVGFVLRVSSNGQGDSSFPLVILPPQGGGAAATLNAVALDPAGGIVVGGAATTNNQSEAVFERLTCSGAPGGFQVTPSSTGFDIDTVGANAVTVAGGRRLVGAGEFRDSGLNSAALWGFESSGAGDFATVAPSGADGNAIAVDPQGNFVVAGSNVPSGLAPSGFVARYTGFGGPASGTSPCGGSVAPPPTPTPPSVSTGSASAITTDGASLSGSVNPNGDSTSYHFDYGTSNAYGSHTPTVSAGAGTSAVSASATVSGLAPGTTYHFRLVASNSAGPTDGAEQTFTTRGKPPPPGQKLDVSVKNVNGVYKTSDVAKHGLKVAVGCNHACSISVWLAISAQNAKRLLIKTVFKRCTKVNGHQKCRQLRGYRALKLSLVEATLQKAGSKAFVLHLAHSLTSALEKQQSLDATLVVSVTSPQATKAVVDNKKVTFQR